MLKRALVLGLVGSLLATAALASEGKKSSGPAGQYVDLQPVALPIVVGGALVNYVFVNVRVNILPGADIQKARDKEPFFRDALVRDGHRSPFVLASDYQKVDETRLIAVLMREAVAIAGPHVVQSVVVLSQTPQRRVFTPMAQAAPHP